MQKLAGLPVTYTYPRVNPTRLSWGSGWKFITFAGIYYRQCSGDCGLPTRFFSLPVALSLPYLFCWPIFLF